ncbi:MAG: carboxypeptidase regulatory-like domain-containing protein [Nitrospirae bacterium]|nr:carboxypeptidase regulatory-like domain-containing protein [Nitrospirota bacterium]
MLRLLIAGTILLGMVGYSGISSASDYEEIAVSNGGTITGKVRLKGPIPEPRVFPVVLYPFGPFCKKISDGQGNIRLEEFIVGTDGGMQDTIVAVQQVKKGKRFAPIKNELVAVNCMFHPADVSDEEQFRVKDGKLKHAHPLVMALENDRPISVVNKDPIIHNGQVFQSEKGNIILNFPLPVSDQPRGGILHFAPGKRISEMICGMHEFMQSWGFVVDNPYYARTKRDGDYRIDGLPPGTYRVTAWHPHLKPVEQEITVSADGAVSLDFEFDSRKVVRPSYESQEKFRIGPEARPHEHLEQCEEPYCN